MRAQKEKSDYALPLNYIGCLGSRVGAFALFSVALAESSDERGPRTTCI